ncbi:MAG TPA: Crp/Fnr family transcriptional regulator [Candidatus Saccharimonadales bacterium]|jgi:CRP-like cAMP-binding protein|nr:Crp/Fnr family transcriptional regulator [Candidatus Saccharimonadales bacterium]
MATNSNFGDKIRPGSERNLSALADRFPASTRRTLPPSAQLARVALVRFFTLFNGIPANDCSQIVTAARERQFSRGEIIHIEGASIRQVVLLTSGSAKMVQCGQNGSAVILRLCGPGEIVGSLGISMQAKYRSTPQALAASSALVWESSIFETLSSRFPSLRLNVSYILYKQLEDMEDRFREISTERVAPRLARQILRLMEQVGIVSNGSVEISITREELAQLIGTSLFTVSRLLSQWDRNGIVTTRREGFTVEDMQALKDLTE